MLVRCESWWGDVVVGSVLQTVILLLCWVRMKMGHQLLPSDNIDLLPFRKILTLMQETWSHR